MMSKILFDQQALLPGEAREFQVWSDASKILVRVECFKTGSDKPAGKDTCPQCGSFTVASGQKFRAIASLGVFKKDTGYVLVSIKDSKGDRKAFKIPVIHQHAEQIPDTTETQFNENPDSTPDTN